MKLLTTSFWRKTQFLIAVAFLLNSQTMAMAYGAGGNLKVDCTGHRQKMQSNSVLRNQKAPSIDDSNSVDGNSQNNVPSFPPLQNQFRSGIVDDNIMEELIAKLTERLQMNAPDWSFEGWNDVQPRGLSKMRAKRVRGVYGLYANPNLPLKLDALNLRAPLQADMENIKQFIYKNILTPEMP